MEISSYFFVCLAKMKLLLTRVVYDIGFAYTSVTILLTEQNKISYTDMSFLNFHHIIILFCRRIINMKTVKLRILDNIEIMLKSAITDRITDSRRTIDFPK